MDPPIKKKTLSRASLSPQRKDKCIVFPLVRYNEFREPVCQACNVVMLESIRAHLASPEHNEVMEKLKANAAGSTEDKNAKPVTGTNNSPKANPEQPQDTACQLPEFSQDVPRHESPSALPRDFCDDSVSKVTETMDPPKEQEHQESIVSPSTDEVLTSSKRGRPRKTKPTKFVINEKSNPTSTPRRSKRIKHVADKTANNVPEVSSSEELLKVKLITLLKGRTAENSQADGKEVSSDIDALVIYKRKRLPRKRSSGQISKSPKKTAPSEPPSAAISSSTTASPPHQDPPAATSPSADAPHIENTNTAEPVLSKSLVEEVEKVNPAPANAQEQVASSKGQESPDQVDPKVDEVSTGNTPLDLEAINKMIEDDPLSAIENILTGKVSICSKTPQSITQSEQPKVQGSPADVLSKELKDLMQIFSLGDFVTDYEQMSKVLLILEELQKNEKFLSLEQQAFIKAFRLFFNNAVTHRKQCDTAGIKKVELNRAKEDILLKLQEVKHTQEQITSTISNANNRVNEISSYIEQLEERLSKLKEERETFQLAIKEGEKQRETLKNDSILWAHQTKDLVFDLAEIEAKEKILGQQLETDNDAYDQFKASFPF
ncbi:fibrous sheath CABYR-binding protein-like isoform X2 [Glycine soja]|uniref:fibrous sheath CABYR-binding protein-like isoform X2 n=1 Tax=Glycine soja TaxID=3848 RepID=UPI001040A2EB|nr:fibrous sheath CABYR-binding protein-like isoform X2 [Glycine soja]